MDFFKRWEKYKGDNDVDLSKDWRASMAINGGKAYLGPAKTAATMIQIVWKSSKKGTETYKMPDNRTAREAFAHLGTQERAAEMKKNEGKTYEKYLNETLENEPFGDDDVALVSDTLSTEDIYKLKVIATRLGDPQHLTTIKRTVEKVYRGEAVTSAKEKAALMDILRFYLSPDKAKFRTILARF